MTPKHAAAAEVDLAEQAKRGDRGALEELYPTKLAEVVPAHQTKHELTYGPRSPYLASA